MVTQPPASQASQPPVGSAPTPSDDGTTLPPLSETPIDQLDGHLYGDKPLKIDVGSAEPNKEPAAPAAPPVAEPPKGDAPVVPPVPPTDPDKILPNRIPTAQFTEAEQQAIALLRDMRATDPGATLKDALALVELRNVPAPEPAPPAAPEPTALEKLRAEKTALDAEIAEATEESARITPELAKKFARQAEIAASIAVESDREQTRQFVADQQAQDEHGRLIAGIEKTKGETLQDFPSAADPTSPLGKACAAVIAEWRNSERMAPILSTEIAPRAVTNEAADRVAREMAAEKGISFVAARSSLMATGTPVDRTQRAPTASGASAPTPASPATSLDSLLSSPESFDPAKVDAALYKSNAFFLGAA